MKLLEEAQIFVEQANQAVLAASETIHKLVAENAALKGDQVPVGFTSERALAEVYCGESSRFGPLDDVGDIPLYDRPQKPVVLLPPAYEKSADLTEYHQGWNACRNYMLAEAKEVGGIVKDGE